MIDRKAALVTGAARGIGNAVAVQLAKEGFTVAVMDVIDEEKVSENLDKIKENGNPFIYLQSNITSSSARKEAADKIMAAFERIDVLVNNAGVAPGVRMDILETTVESMDFVLGINLKGTFFLTQLIANIMVEETKVIEGIRPKIINISSMSAFTSSTQRGEYCIS